MNKYEVVAGNTEFAINTYFKEKRVQRILKVFFDRYADYYPTIEEDFNAYLKTLEKAPDIINIFMLENQIEDLKAEIEELKYGCPHTETKQSSDNWVKIYE